MPVCARRAIDIAEVYRRIAIEFAQRSLKRYAAQCANDMRREVEVLPGTACDIPRRLLDRLAAIDIASVCM